MATNNIMTAKNTFGEGLIMDFAPDNTQANTLTSALNATLLTFNGNEMSLQNDMGNGRVETARLPEGYIPMGSCEFGDIIYIISYNPLTNKSLIGCFPSPERNISQDEIQNNIKNSEVKWDDFQESDSAGNPTGKLKAHSLKKVLISKNINPGDLYIIYTNTISEDNKKCLSDYGNTDNIHGLFPKLVKIHIVSLEDSGKITYLDSETKWYDTNYYIKECENITKETILKDIDSYRSLVDSAYSVFLNKVSGKLALLFELESIKSFSCTYSIYDGNHLNLKPFQLEDIYRSKYLVCLNTSWTSDNPDVNPQGLVLLDSHGLETSIPSYVYDNISKEYKLSYNNLISILDPAKGYLSKDGIYFNFKNYYYDKVEEESSNYESFIKNNSYQSKINKEDIKDLKKLILALENGSPIYNLLLNVKYYKNKITETPPKIYDSSIINSYLHQDVIVPLATVDIPKYQIIEGKKIPLLTKPLIWNFTVAPSMPYGVLENLKVTLSIDFSKLNSGEISLTEWRYYNEGLNSTLTFGLESYPEFNKGIKEVVLQFYDNLGFAAAYHITNKNSYSGSFTEYIELNKTNPNYKLNNIDYEGHIITHPGLKSSEGTVIIKQNEVEEHYLDDAGTLYANMLYKVLIVVKYCNKDSLGNYIEDSSNYRYFSRWYYTLELFNTKYHTIKDFDVLKPELTFDVTASMKTTDLNHSTFNYESSKSLNANSTDYDTIGAKVYEIGKKVEPSKGNINFKVIPGLVEDFGVFNLKIPENLENDKNPKYIQTLITLGNLKILIPKDIKLLSSKYEVTPYASLLPIITNTTKHIYGPNLNNLLGITTKPSETGLDIYDKDKDNYGYEKCIDNFSLDLVEHETTSIDNFEYINSKGEKEVILQPHYIKKPLQDIENGVDLKLLGIMFQKYIYSNIKENLKGKQLKSVINQGPLETYGLHLSGNHLYFNEILTMHMGEAGGKHTRWGGFYKRELSTNWASPENVGIRETSSNDAWNPSLTNPEILNLFSQVQGYLMPLAICYDKSQNAKIDGVVVSRNCNNTFTKYLPLNEEVWPGNMLYNKGYAPLTWLDDTVPTEKNKFIINFLCFRDPKTNLVEITNDPFITNYTSLTFKGKDYNNLINVTLADLLGSIYAQLYSVTPYRKSIFYRDNLTYLEKFSELWLKDIILNITTDDGIDYKKLLTFNKIPLEKFIKDINLKFPKIETVISESDSNINITVNDCQKTIDFQYKIDYDIDDIKLSMEDKSESRAITLISYNQEGGEVTSTVYGDVNDNTLYTIEDFLAIPLSHSSTIKIVSNWYGNDLQLSYTTSNDLFIKASYLSDIFTINNGYLSLSNYKKHPNYFSKFNIKWWGTGDDPGLTGISGGSILNIFKI